jgi:hypothetical protein
MNISRRWRYAAGGKPIQYDASCWFLYAAGGKIIAI